MKANSTAVGLSLPHVPMIMKPYIQVISQFLAKCRLSAIESKRMPSTGDLRHMFRSSDSCCSPGSTLPINCGGCVSSHDTDLVWICNFAKRVETMVVALNASNKGTAVDSCTVLYQREFGKAMQAPGESVEGTTSCAIYSSLWTFKVQLWSKLDNWTAAF